MDDAAEERRPRSTLKLLGGLILASLVGLVLVAACLSLVASSTPRHVLEIPTGELTTGVPRFYAQPSFGADPQGRTFGVWVLVPESGSARAFASRTTGSQCSVAWRPQATVEGVTGVFQDECTSSSYDREGRVLAGPALRGMDTFPVDVTGAGVIVDLEHSTVGFCRPDVTSSVPCSPDTRPR